MAHILSGRAETPTQSRILTLVRDEGPLDRMELAARLGVSRTTVAAETGRLVELGLAVDGGPAASRGGRRSTLVDLDPRLRFVGIQLGATSLRVAVTDGRLGVLRRSANTRAEIRRGPEAVLAEALDLTRKLLAEEGVERPAGSASAYPARSTSRAACRSPPAHARLGRLPRARRALARARRAGAARQRRQRDGARRAAGRRRPAAPTTTSSSRSAPASAAGSWSAATSTAAPTARAGDIGHIRAESGGPVCACGNQGCLEAFFGGAALARDATAAAQSGRSSVLAELLEEHGTLTAATSARRSASVTPSPSSSRATADAGWDPCWPAWCPSSTPA